MGYFQVRYDSRVVIYDRRGFIRLATVYQAVGKRLLVRGSWYKSYEGRHVRGHWRRAVR